MSEVTPPPCEVSVIALDAAVSGAGPHYRFKWVSAGGRRRQLTTKLVRHDQVEEVRRIIAFAAARDTKSPAPRKRKTTNERKT